MVERRHDDRDRGGRLRRGDPPVGGGDAQLAGAVVPEQAEADAEDRPQPRPHDAQPMQGRAEPAGAAAQPEVLAEQSDPLLESFVAVAELRDQLLRALERALQRRRRGLGPARRGLLDRVGGRQRPEDLGESSRAGDHPRLELDQLAAGIGQQPAGVGVDRAVDDQHAAAADAADPRGVVLGGERVEHPLAGELGPERDQRLADRLRMELNLAVLTLLGGAHRRRRVEQMHLLEQRHGVGRERGIGADQHVERCCAGDHPDRSRTEEPGSRPGRCRLDLSGRRGLHHWSLSRSRRPRP